ncbi:hypothetical protein DFH09DRAFT_1071564 [Mycena vulgaris]|nr:hypothetical protein DFH09DRAFT_1071564 [Mycena vulgaris]
MKKKKTYSAISNAAFTTTAEEDPTKPATLLVAYFPELPKSQKEAHAITTDAGKLILRRDLAHRLALFAEHDLEHPVAHWRGPTPGPPTLVLYPSTEDFYAQIIEAFTLKELKLRMSEKTGAVLAPVSRAAILDKTSLAMFNRA